jgi:hypothetical protein
MGLLRRLEYLFVPSRRKLQQHVDLKEIFCKRKDDDYIKRFRTAATGCEYSNPDGSDRQDALQKVKVGEKIRLIWDASGGADIVYLVRRGRAQQLSMPDCFGRLNDKVAADVIRWLTHDNIVTSARVVKITGGTHKNPKQGCVLELTTYPGPEKKN